jgi:hypothetical protein
LLDGSGVRREAHAPFCEGLGVKSPRSTHHIPAITGKIYVIIENLTDVIEELNEKLEPSSPIPAPAPAQPCGMEEAAGAAGMESVSMEGVDIEETGIEGVGIGGAGIEGVKNLQGVEGAGIAEEEKAEAKEHGLTDPPEKGLESPEGKGFDLFRYLSSNEGLELIRLESTRQSLLRAQGFLDEKKQGLIRLARSRQKSS